MKKISKQYINYISLRVCFPIKKWCIPGVSTVNIECAANRDMDRCRHDENYEKNFKIYEKKIFFNAQWFFFENYDLDNFKTLNNVLF